VVVSPRTAALRPRNLALLMLVLAVAGAAFGGYLYWSLERARSDITRTGSRLQQAEAELARTEQRVRESLERIEYTETELDQALDELKRLGEASARAMRAEFAKRLQDIADDSREALARLEERDVQGREQLRHQAQEQAEALRGELADRMVESYRQLQALEQRLLAAMVERMAAREPPGERLKRVFRQASEATLLIHARYEIEFLREGTTSEGGSFGTGFLASPTGLAITAQHVLFPWRYDRDFLVLEQLGLVRVVPDSVRWLVWRAGARALPDPADPSVVEPETAYGTAAGQHRLRLLHAPPPETSVEMVTSPVGVIEIPMPVPGASDSAVLQLLEFGAAFPHLAPAEGTARPGALDEVLLLGYPFSRLPDGVAAPQGIRGLVRTPGDELLELDAAVHAGLSGGPVVDRNGTLVGMVTATLRSDVYAVALSLDSLLGLLAETRAQVRSEEARLAAGGCDPGEVDGVFDARTEAAYRCEETPMPAGSPRGGS
jgi:S1-C subfamily serine protease